MSYQLFLALPIITHIILYMVREVHFATHNHASLTAGMSVFLFIVHTAIAVDMLRSETIIWDNILRGNIHTSMAKL